MVGASSTEINRSRTTATNGRQRDLYLSAISDNPRPNDSIAITGGRQRDRTITLSDDTKLEETIRDKYNNVNNEQRSLTTHACGEYSDQNVSDASESIRTRRKILGRRGYCTDGGVRTINAIMHE